MKSYLLLLLSVLVCRAVAINIKTGIEKRPDLSEFARMLREDPVFTVFLEHRTATVFAPNDEAIRKYRESGGGRVDSSKLVSQHIVGLEVERELFPLSVTTQRQEAPPVYLNYMIEPPPANDRYWSGHQEKKYFINNALIIDRAEFQAQKGDKQILYVIDQVIDPKIESSSMVPPLALELISNPGSYGINLNAGSFLNRIQQNTEDWTFKRPGNHTFFVPISDARGGVIFDSAVVKGHTIPNQVLFLRVMGKNSYPSGANADGPVAVDLSLLNRTVRLDTEPSYFIQSNTIRSDATHRKGAVMSRIVQANVPVKNGVVHFIEKPLMIVDMSILDFIGSERDGKLKLFNNLINQIPELRNAMAQSQPPLTLLAPVDMAFNNLFDETTVGERPQIDPEEAIRRIVSNDELKRKMLLHVVNVKAVSTDDVKSGDSHFQTSAEIPDNHVTFRLAGDEKNQKLTVEGGGVNATVIQSDIGATNGIVHIIDRVLGVPFLNMLDKFRSDPELSFSYNLSQQGQGRWADQLTQQDRRYTFFVPNNAGWEEFHKDNPSEYKQLHNAMMPSVARKILDRHLAADRQKFTTDLEQSGKIYTTNGELKITKFSEEYFVEWEGIRTRIIRPNIQTLNGVIHVIEKPLVLRRDFMNGSQSLTSASSCWMLLIASIILLRFI